MSHLHLPSVKLVCISFDKLPEMAPCEREICARRPVFYIYVYY